MRHDYATTNINFKKFASKERFKYLEVNYGRTIERIKKDAKVLEIGPGDGSFLLYLKEKGIKPSLMFCVDQSKKVCLFIKSKNIIPAQNIYNQDLFYFLRNCHETFDLIFMQHVIEHFKKKEIDFFFSVCREKLLNKNGLLIMETPNASNIIYGPIARAKDYTHETIFTGKSMKEALIKAGFKEKNILIREDQYVTVTDNFIKYLKSTILKLLFWTSKELSNLFYRGIGHNINSFNIIIEVKND